MKARQAGAVGMLALMMSLAGGTAATAKDPPDYSSMAPIAQYLSKSEADEVALARSAAPTAISADATVLSLGPKGYRRVIEGKNHFVCLIVRAWDKDFDDPEFWNPKTR